MRVRCSHVRGSQVRGSQVRAMVGKTRADFLSKHIKYLVRTHMSALIPYRPDDIAGDEQVYPASKQVLDGSSTEI